MKQPFFILGNPRSGTSLLRIMLDSHPNIVVPPESGFIEWLFEKYKDWDFKKMVGPFMKDLYQSKKFETWNLPKDHLLEVLMDHQPNTYQLTCQNIYFAYGNKFGKNLISWGDKNNYYIQHVYKLKHIFPDATFIHLVRDGRDVAASYKKINQSDFKSKYKPTLPNTIERIATEWVSNLEVINNFFQTLKEDKFITLRYEDLLNSPTQQLTRITKFLDLNYHSNMLDYHIRNQKYGIEPIETIEWKKKTLEKIDSSNIGRYKNDLSQFEISEFSFYAKNLLAKFSYT